jgi:hypothetical protein
LWAQSERQPVVLDDHHLTVEEAQAPHLEEGASRADPQFFGFLDARRAPWTVRPVAAAGLLEARGLRVPALVRNQPRAGEDSIIPRVASSFSAARTVTRDTSYRAERARSEGSWSPSCAPPAEMSSRRRVAIRT